MVITVGTVFAQYGRSAGGRILNSIGHQVENSIQVILQRIIATPGAVQRGIWLVGEGGRRKLDYFIEIAQRTAIIEVKYKIPTRAGPQLERLLGQIQTALTPKEAFAKGARVVLFIFRAPTDAQLMRIITALGEDAGMVQHVNGFVGLVQWVSLFFNVGIHMQ